MKSLNTIQKLSQIGRIFSKIAFILSVIGFCGCIAGIISLSFGSGEVTKIGGVALHNLLKSDYGYNVKSITAALVGWLVICAGEAVLAKFAEVYFKKELKAGTPFTLDGAKKMNRLGILTLAIPVGSAIIGGIAEEIIAGFLKIETSAVLDICFDNEANFALGIVFIIISLLCRYGAELADNGGAEK